jgi:hypothetical protein
MEHNFFKEQKAKNAAKHSGTSAPQRSLREIKNKIVIG